MTDADRVKGELESFVRGTFPQVDFLALYPARVAAQNADGTLELVPDDTRLPGLSGVPIRFGTPDTKAVVASGARVLLGFAEGSPAKPIALAWEAASLTSLTFGAGGTTQPVALGQDVRDELDALWLAMQTHMHPTAAPGAPSPPTPVSGPPPTGASLPAPPNKQVKSGTVSVKT